MYSEGELYFDHQSRRWCINGVELHCGAVIEMHHNGEWEAVRIEYNPSAREFYTIPHIRLQEQIKVRYKRY